MTVEVNISSLLRLSETVDEWKPDCVVAAIPTSLNGDFEHLSLPIEDIYNVQIAMYKDAVCKVLECTRTRILVHCEHGLSRSAALAIAKLYQAEPDSVDRFLEQHPEVQPNPLLLLFADEILNADGDLLRRCSGRYKGRHI